MKFERRVGKRLQRVKQFGQKVTSSSGISMLTKRSQSYIAFIFQQATTLRIIPFRWQVKQKVLTPLYGWDAVPASVLLALIMSNTLYLAVRLHQYRKAAMLSAVSRSFHVGLLLAACLASLFGYNNFKRRTEIANYFNTFFRQLEVLEAQFLVENYVPRVNSCELMLQCFTVMPFVQGFAGIFIYVLHYREPRYMFYVFRDILPCWCLVFFLALEYIIYVSYWFTVLVAVCAMFTFWYGTAYWLKEMRCPNPESARKGATRETLGQLREPGTSLNIYGSLTIICKLFRDAMSPLVLPVAQFFIILLPTSTNYILIRHHHTMNPFITLCLLSLALACMGICVFAYPVAAHIHSFSIAFISAFKKTHVAVTLTPRQNKKVRSCRPLKVQVGNLMFIRPFTVLKLINSIIYWTMRSLLIFR